MGIKKLGNIPGYLLKKAKKTVSFKIIFILCLIVICWQFWGIKEELSAVEYEISSLESEVSDLDYHSHSNYHSHSEVSSLESEVSSLERKVSSLESEVSDLDYHSHSDLHSEDHFHYELHSHY